MKKWNKGSKDKKSKQYDHEVVWKNCSLDLIQEVKEEETPNFEFKDNFVTKKDSKKFQQFWDLDNYENSN